LLRFTWSGLDVSCCMGNAWVGPSGFFFSRHMGCKFNDSYDLICGINFKAVKLVQAGYQVDDSCVHLIAIALLRPFLLCMVWRKCMVHRDCSRLIGIVGVGSMS
jgi:hypothetical protein